MEHQYKNENLHSIADILRGTFTLFDVAFHSAETHLGGAGTKIIQRYADVCRFLGELPGKLEDVDALGCNLMNMMDTAFSRFWLIVERTHVDVEGRHFWHTYSSYIFSAHVQISEPGHSRSGHKITSSDLTSEKKFE